MAKEQDLQAQLDAARAALAKSEQELSELLADTQPTTDLATEEKRLREMGIREAALKRVIIAQRQAVEDAAAALQTAVHQRAEAELADVMAQVETLVRKLDADLWQMYEATEVVAGLHSRIANLRREIGDPGFGYAPGAIAVASAIRENVALMLTSDTRTATSYAGPGERGIRRRDPEAEKTKREADEKRVAAAKQRRKELAILQASIDKMRSK